MTDCKKDSKTDNPNNISEADKITDWLKIDGAVKKIGNLPSATAGAPVLTSLSPTTGGVTDGSFVFSFVASDDFDGIYLKVKGASSYLDIPLSSTSGKAGKSGIMGGVRRDGIAYRDPTGYIIVVVYLDDASNPEEFCYEYCIYDATNGVSNSEEVCVSISNGGGLDELVGKWKLYKHIDYGTQFEEPLIYDYIWGEESLESYPQFCGDTTFITNDYQYWEFFPSGDFLENEKKVVKSGILCDEAKKEYYNNQKIEIYNGFWFYNSSSNLVDLFYSNSITNQGTPIQKFYSFFGFIAFSFKVTINGNNLSLYCEGGGSPFEYFFTRY